MWIFAHGAIFGASLLSIGFILWVAALKIKVSVLTKEIKAHDKQIKQHSCLDPLTQVYNYRYFAKRLRESISRAQRKASFFSLVKIDIELLKNINAIYGDATGDAILREFARFLIEITRTSDIVARMDGDEFGIIISGSRRDEAVKLAQRVKDMLRNRRFGSAHQKIYLNVSIAIAAFPDDSVSEAGFMHMLDKCLQKSKDRGGVIVTASNLDDSCADKPFTPNVCTIGELKHKVSMLEATLGRNIIESIVGFANTIRAKDMYTADHASQTAQIATAIGKKIGLNAKQLEVIRYSSLLHDLGKIGVPEKILKKPGALTEEEFEEIKRHPIIGVEIIRPLHELTDMIPPILYHHERIDGSGYPYGLSDKRIPVEAKIVAIADTFQALTSDRVYRKAYSVKQALEIIERENGTHFDREISKAFREIISV